MYLTVCEYRLDFDENILHLLQLSLHKIGSYNVKSKISSACDLSHQSVVCH